MEEDASFPEPEYSLRPSGDLRVQRVRLTLEGLHRLEGELHEVEDEGLPAVASRIREIKASCSDLAESVEYSVALEDLAQLQARAVELRAMIGGGEVIAPPRTAAGRVHLGSTITLALDGEEETFQIVGAAESDAVSGRISEESPLGRAVLGSRTGDVIEWSAPAGPMRGKVVRVA